MTETYIGNNAVLKYFETHDRKTWNYEHFLNELKEIIINSPPYTEDWSGLDGRFWVVVISYDIVRSRGFTEVFGAQDKDNKHRKMKSFFQDIILEREKRNAGKNYVIEGVKILNEARFSSSVEVISTINKQHLQIEKVNNEPPRNPEHQIYQSQQINVKRELEEK
ncbi:9415_t:CDS:2 [Acaulospora morrowiae]|uniref:9415_t:CDS:1 n=1 Tax=Acaulospora morrowiae TaxID=94023 RepID=A0A9N9IKT9_9GLOM|nr:9415_t:CDS:2 [Acaulospora morrowiae]